MLNSKFSNIRRKGLMPLYHLFFLQYKTLLNSRILMQLEVDFSLISKLLHEFLTLCCLSFSV